MPKMRWTDDGHRKTHRCRNPTSFSSRPGHRSRMKRLSATRNLCACQRAQSLRALHSANRTLLLSQALFWYGFCAFVTFSAPAVVCRALPHSLGASRHRTFPQLNLHKARAGRNHGRLPSNGFIESAPEHRARAHFLPESAPPIKRYLEMTGV